MNCEQYFYLIDDLIAGELDERTAGQVDSHVFACWRCRRQFETIKREKDIYARYLFDVEPPNDLWANFQTRLAAEKKKMMMKNKRKTSLFSRISANAPARKTSVFDFRRFFSPLLAGAALILFFGFGLCWLKFASDEADNDTRVAQTEPSDLAAVPSVSVVTAKSEPADSPMKNNRGEKNAASERNHNQNNKLSGKYKSLKAESVSAAGRKSSFVEAVKIGQKNISADAQGRNAAIKNRPNEEARRQELQMKNLDHEIAGQIEKVELLLRSFRNARATEANETFDVAYEKGQARKLLGKNGQLRRDAETYRILYAEELLNRVEPYLLEIANLADHPAPDKVLDIRERVKNQSVIASLQTY